MNKVTKKVLGSLLSLLLLAGSLASFGAAWAEAPEATQKSAVTIGGKDGVSDPIGGLPGKYKVQISTNKDDSVRTPGDDPWYQYEYKQGETVPFLVKVTNISDSGLRLRAYNYSWAINPTKLPDAYSQCVDLSNGYPEITWGQLRETINRGPVLLNTDENKVYGCADMGNYVQVQSYMYNADFTNRGEIIDLPAGASYTYKQDITASIAGYYQIDFNVQLLDGESRVLNDRLVGGTIHRVTGAQTMKGEVTFEKMAAAGEGHLWTPSEQVMVDNEGATAWFRVTAQNRLDKTIDQIKVIDQFNLKADEYQAKNPELYVERRAGEMERLDYESSLIHGVRATDTDGDAIVDHFELSYVDSLAAGQDLVYFFKLALKSADYFVNFGPDAKSELQNSAQFIAYPLNTVFNADAKLTISAQAAPVDHGAYDLDDYRQPEEWTENEDAAVEKFVSDNDESLVKVSHGNYAGQTVTYTLNYKNEGNTVLHGAMLIDDLAQAYMEPVDYSGATWTGETMNWTLGDLEPGASGTKSFTAKFKSSLPNFNADLEVKNMVELFSQADNLSVTDSVISIIPSADLPTNAPYLVTTKTMTDINGGAVEPGDPLRYQVTVSNKGTAAAQDVIVLDDVAANMNSLVVESIPAGATDRSTATGGANGRGQVNVLVPTLNAGQTVGVTYTLKIDSVVADGELVKNGVKVTAGGGISAGASTEAAIGTIHRGEGEIAGATTQAADVPTGPVGSMALITLGIVLAGAAALSFFKMTLPILL